MMTTAMMPAAAAEFVDADGNIVIPKEVRPVVGLQETLLGGKKGAARQYRYGNLHVRDYGSHYTAHLDRVDPRTSPVGHLIEDAPEYLVGAMAAVIAGRHVGAKVYERRKKDGSISRGRALAEAALAAIVAGSAAGNVFYRAAKR
ncbi:hypothetical protein [Nitrososphaera sp.]|uniref:hypothetical protein n=1 Tax=Nitrososphaera sp. TaxID=1971748 RepID=UPI00307DA682